ncbi:phosphatidylethanolamine N-methyltransferase isoform X1 [Trichechus manatus latirostris]|uniref:Phosphatidylethanolamine N-methyltransferase isoform X1 n=1 Tax=Trichechus manatus latirostris TaxID=127582 RepID=A0A2Y9R782_TRIMA|nr:phosphatidylethanolamine N-methyltransferase isoform X1 [Trichechus manatus latirostris]
MIRLLGYVNPSDPSFVAAVLTITFNPLFWNVVARWEQKTRRLSKAFGSPYLACYALGGAILLLNLVRSHCFTQAMLSQPKMESLDNAGAYRVGLVLLGVGALFVLTSFSALGFTGTFLAHFLLPGKRASSSGSGPHLRSVAPFVLGRWRDTAPGSSSCRCTPLAAGCPTFSSDEAQLSSRSSNKHGLFWGEEGLQRQQWRPFCFLHHVYINM